MLQDFSYEGKSRDGPKIIKIIKINRSFLGTGITAAILNAAGTIPQHKKSNLLY